MTRDCLYCGLQFSETIQFCPNCGRPTESGFIVRTMQEFDLERLRRETKEKDSLKRQPVLTETVQGETSRTTAHTTDRRDNDDGDEKRASTTARSSRS